MKYLVLSIVIAAALFASSVDAAKKPDYRGMLLLQTQSYGRLWYVSSTTNTRYYIKNAQEAGRLARALGGNFITNKNGVWYRDQKTNKRSFLGATDDVIFRALVRLSRGVTDAQLRIVPMNTEQVVPDTAFASVASASLHAGAYSGGSNSDVVLPIASLTKLMTALVLLDHAPQWDARVTIAESHIAFPKRYVGDDTTSEVSLKAGQRVIVDDLWTAMLVSSSNQAAVALMDSTGLSERQFIKKMNEKARALGLSKTVFYDCAGLDAHTVSTAREMALLAQAAFESEKISRVSSQKEARISLIDEYGVARILPIKNRNYSVLAFEPDGVKTGFLVEAQRNVALKKGDTVIVVLHARSMKERNTIIRQLL